MDQKSYLARLNYTGSTHVSIETLNALQRAHLRTVPFENLSIHIGERIHLNEEWVFKKIVDRNRGGFCFELNGLFNWLLNSLGFQTTLLSARVWSDDHQDFGQDFSHLVLRVDLDDAWLVDVGFGRSFPRPLRIFHPAPQIQGKDQFRIRQNGETFIYERYENTWLPEYVFTLAPRKLSDFHEMCLFHQNSPDSIFTRRWLITIENSRGRHTLLQDKKDYRFITTENNTRTEVIIQGYENAELLLEELFGIKDLTSRRRQK